MLNIQNMTYHQSGEPLFLQANLQVFANQRVGLVGFNGCGKSTLFKLIRGLLRVDGGDISLQAGKSLAFVEQEIINSDLPALQFVLDGDVRLRQLEAILQRASHDEAWFAAQHEFELIDGYSAAARAAQLLAGLGFASDSIERPVASFSGGWRMRLNLARALMYRADLLLLDEPTNHLDLEAIVWLEQYLLHYPGSILLVSHDREFLNTTVNRIAHVNQQKIDVYTGNYDDFERARAERISQQNVAFEQQQSKIAHLEDFVRRFRAKATKAKQAQSRLKALERLTLVAPAHVSDGHFNLQIDSPERSPDVLMRVDKASFAYGEKVLFKNLSLVLRAGARVALLGPNGAGKSSLIKLLVGELLPTHGQVATTPDIRVGYFAQHQLEHLVAEFTPLDHMLQIAPKETELNLRTYLGRFGLAGARENRPVASFSGGEKSRLALALLAWSKPHLLLLDEPTNHLDLDMRDSLMLALEAYEGAVVLVSHDRSLIRAVADELWLVADGDARLFEGDLSDYQQWIEARRPQESVKATKTEKIVTLKKPNNKALLAKQAKLETNLNKLQQELSVIHEQLADVNTYTRSADFIQNLNQKQDALTRQIDELEEAWLLLEQELTE